MTNRLMRKYSTPLNTRVPGETAAGLVKRIKSNNVDLDKFFQNADSMSTFKLPVPGFSQPQIRQMINDMRGNPDYYMGQLKKVPGFLLERAVTQNPQAFEGVSASNIPSSMGKTAQVNYANYNYAGIKKSAGPLAPLAAALPWLGNVGRVALPWITRAGNITKVAPRAAWGAVATAGTASIPPYVLGSAVDAANPLITTLNANLPAWSEGRDLDSLREFLPQASQGEFDKLRPLLRMDPHGAWDFLARRAESKGIELYRPSLLQGIAGQTADAYRYGMSQSKEYKDLASKLNQRDFGGALQGVQNLYAENNKLIDRSNLFAENDFRALANSIPGLWDPNVRKLPGYTPPIPMAKRWAKEMYDGMTSAHGNFINNVKNDPKNILGHAGQLTGDLMEAQNKFSPHGYVPQWAMNNLIPGAALEKIQQEVSSDPRVAQGYFLGHVDRRPGASDNLGYALLRKFTDTPTPEGYKSVREAFQTDVKDPLGQWRDTLMSDPKLGLANAWNNPYGKAAILGGGAALGLGALGIKSLMDRKKKEEEERIAKLAPLQTSGLHRYGAY